MARLDIACDASFERHARRAAFPARSAPWVAVDKKYVAVIADPPGFSRHGIDAEAVTKKFNAVTAKRLGESARARIIDAVMALDGSPSCGALSKALATD